MNLINKTENSSEFQFLPSFSYKPVVFIVLSNLPKYLMSFGIVGNVISLFVFTRPCLNNKTNSGKLYAFICLLSLILIVYEMSSRNLENFYEFKLRLPRNTQSFIDMILLQYWSWIQALITFDRFVIVFYPVKGFRIMSKKWILYSIIFGMLIFIIVINSPNYIRCSTYMIGNKTFKANDIMCDDVIVLTGIIKISMQFVIPYLIIVILDLMVIIRLRKSKSGLGERQSATNSKSLRFSRNMIFIDFIYLIFNFPPIIFNAYYLILSINPSSINLYINMIALFIIVFRIFILPFNFSCLLLLIGFSDPNLSRLQLYV